MSRTDDVTACRTYVLAALTTAMTGRDGLDMAWIDHERLAVALAANGWAEAHGYPRRITVDDIEQIEIPALGHVDYATKLSLYVAEFIVVGCDPDASWTGVDQTDMSDPAKIWRCDGCGAVGTSSELRAVAQHAGRTP